MSTTADNKPPRVPCVLQFPLIRIPLLGGLLFLGMGISNGFRANNEGTPLIGLALIIVMVILALAVYAGFVRLVERRPVSELSLPGICLSWR